MKPLLSLVLLAIAALGLSGCDDHHSPSIPPAAPRGVYSVTGDHSVTLYWYRNTEPDITGYRVYQSDCAGGQNCPYVRIGTVGASVDSFVVRSLTNGVTQFYAVAAVNRQGQESDLSENVVYDTPRPAGTDAVVYNSRVASPPAVGAGWDFSAAAGRSSWDPLADIVYSDTLGYREMYAADIHTDIQDAGWHASLDAIDFAPTSGWSPTGAVELIPGHCYLVWTRDNHFAKFRVTSFGGNAVVFDWAYQTAVGNGELHARPVGHRAANALQASVTQR